MEINVYSEETDEHLFSFEISDELAEKLQLISNLTGAPMEDLILEAVHEAVSFNEETTNDEQSDPNS